MSRRPRALTATSPGQRREPEPAYRQLAAITVPVRVIVGTLDLEYLREQAGCLAASVADGELVAMPDVAHLPQLEQPEAFVAAFAQDRR